MASSVRSLSNHYETLRVPPTASSDQISEAFKAQMRAVRVRPDITVGRLGQLSLAYETLRDPTRRRAYDESIGLGRPAPPPPLNVPAFMAGAYGSVRAKPGPTSYVPKKNPVQPDVPEEPRVATFIASSLREPPASREAEVAPTPAPRGPARVTEMALQPRWNAGDDQSPRTAPLFVDRNRANIAAGVLGLGILGLAVSLPAANYDRLAAVPAPAQAVTVGLPPATPVQDYVVPPKTAAAATAGDRSVVEEQPAMTAAEAQKPSSDQTPAQSSGGQPVAESQPVEIAAGESPARGESPSIDTTPADSAPTATVQAKMPLPNATIARTLARIGYACGSVSSIVADAGPGVFKITCSSGDSYRAAPVGGRYHFRRLGRE